MNESRLMDTTGQDWANYLSHEVSGNGMICLVALLSRRPDAATLRKAAMDLIGLQPVLGCRFDETQEPPVWVPVSEEGLFKEIAADTLRHGVHMITQDAMAQGRQMDVSLLTAPDQTALCLRFDHAATDGCGAKGCLELLARCYQQRCGAQITTTPPCLDRSDEQVYTRCGLSDYRMAFKREKPSLAPVFTVPYAGMDGAAASYRWISMPLSAVKHANSGTVNDRLLAAYITALAKACGEPRAISIHTTVDLRRYLGKENAPLACNLSGMASVCLTVDQQTSFSCALAEVRQQTTLLKAEAAGLSSAAAMTCLRSMPYGKAKAFLLEAGRKSRASGAAAPILSNLGQIVQGALSFGNAAVTGIVPLLPAMHAPAFMLGASGYGDELTVSAGYYAEERSSDWIENLLQNIRDILVS